MSKENYQARFSQHPDNSIIAKFPPGFFQKGLATNEEFTMQITDTKIYLRRKNGRIITWTKFEINDQ